ncbi:hypothetical protein EAO79_10155 [Plantibacter sp. PA-3-X8]|nr:hypothetical protein EAO79_10155 [Plantibacter sp. PA-3-X8]
MEALADDADRAGRSLAREGVRVGRGAGRVGRRRRRRKSEFCSAWSAARRPLLEHRGHRAHRPDRTGSVVQHEDVPLQPLQGGIHLRLLASERGRERVALGPVQRGGEHCKGVPVEQCHPAGDARIVQQGLGEVEEVRDAG